MAAKERKGVFLSYARKDGEQFSANLLARLHNEAPDIVVKQDRNLLEGGVGWWKQLTTAIDTVEFLILVMTPSVMQSETVAKEWRYARQAGVCVYPVKGASDSELHFFDLPRWMSKTHFFDLDKEWESFLIRLHSGCKVPHVPFMPPDLPENHIHRPDEFDQIKNLLLGPDRNGPVAIATALAGGGGFGKTTLAAALCHDEDIIESFDDGILWVTLGRNPVTMTGLVTVYAALTGERPAFSSVEDAAFHLGEKLENRTCLLVIDDVWDASHLRPYLSKGKECARLFTTRQADIALMGQPVVVDEMSAGQAQALLGNGVAGLPGSSCRELSELLGEWPIALEIARATMLQRIAQGDSAENAVQRLVHGLQRKGPGMLAKNTAELHHRTIGAVLEPSLELLCSDDQIRLVTLSIFPEDVAVPLSVVGALWNLDGLYTEETAQRLSRLSLLKLDLGRGTLRLHDVMRSWLARSGVNATELHHQLVTAWPDWMRLPEVYAWRWLIWHLAQAGRSSDIERVLFDPLWLHAKLTATDVSSLVSDFEHLRSSVEAGLIQKALQLSSHVITRDPSQFASQMTGRLLPYRGRQAIGRFYDALDRAEKGLWLRPLNGALQSPGTGLLRTLTGHSSWVNGVVLSKDGRRAVSASSDCTVKVWDVESGKELRSLNGHLGAVVSVALSEDERRAVSASFDCTLKVWDVESGKELRTLVGHSKAVHSVALSGNGNRALSASHDGLIKVWDVESGQALRTLAGHSSWVHGVALSVDGRCAISASHDGTLKVWDVESGQELRTLVGHSGWGNGVALSADGRCAISASHDGTLKVWDVESGQELRTLVGHPRGVSGVALSRDGSLAVSASEDRTVKVWDVESGQELCSLISHSETVYGVALSGDGRRAISASQDGTLKVWDIDRKLQLRPLLCHSNHVSGVSVSRNGRRAVSASHDSTLKVWDVRGRQVLRSLVGHHIAVYGVAVSEDGRRAISAGHWGSIKVWDLENGQQMRSLNGHTQEVNDVALSRDNRRVISASDDSSLMVWDLQTGQRQNVLCGHRGKVLSVALSGDGRRAVSGSDDDTVKVWDVESGQELQTLSGHTQWVRGVAISQDGRLAVSASLDGNLKVWDVESGQEARTLSGHTRGVYGVALSWDSRLAVSAAEDTAVKVWDVESGLCMATYSCDSGARCCAFADAHTIIAGDDGGRVHFLSLEAPGSNLDELSRVDRKTRANLWWKLWGPFMGRHRKKEQR